MQTVVWRSHSPAFPAPWALCLKCHNKWATSALPPFWPQICISYSLPSQLINFTVRQLPIIHFIARAVVGFKKKTCQRTLEKKKCNKCDINNPVWLHHKTLDRPLDGKLPEHILCKQTLSASFKLLRTRRRLDKHPRQLRKHSHVMGNFLWSKSPSNWDRMGEAVPNPSLSLSLSLGV